jgi:hypothetical protein
MIPDLTNKTEEPWQRTPRTDAVGRSRLRDEPGRLSTSSVSFNREFPRPWTDITNPECLRYRGNASQPRIRNAPKTGALTRES